MRSIEPGISRFPDAQLRILGLVLMHHPGMTGILMHSHLSGFPADHRLLAGDAPVVAGQRAALAERAMAGHHERDRGFPDRSAYRARRLGTVDAARDV